MDTTKAPKASIFDHEKFTTTLEAIGDHHGFENQNQLASAIGVGHEVVSRLRNGEGISGESLCRILAWSKIDIRKFFVENGAAPTE
jgi:transcriptional regulator with XRE-family HTH domain